MESSLCNRRARRTPPLPRARLVFVVLTAAGGCVAVAPAPAGAGSGGCPGTVEQRTFELLNAHRAGADLAPLLPERRLVRAAAGHAADMARLGLVSHRGSDGSEPPLRVSAAGYRWTLVAENVAVGQTSPDEVTAGWMASPGHRRNILGAGFRHVGIAMAAGVPGPGGELGRYWVTVFGATSAPGDVPGDGCHPRLADPGSPEFSPRR